MKPPTIIDRGRGPELAGTRITVYDIIPYLEAGHTSVYIAAVLQLSTDEAETLVRYIEEHRPEVMAVHRRIEERIARGNPPEVEERLRGGGERLLRLRDQLRQRPIPESGNGAGTSQ